MWAGGGGGGWQAARGGEREGGSIGEGTERQGGLCHRMSCALTEPRRMQTVCNSTMSASKQYKSGTACYLSVGNCPVVCQARGCRVQPSTVFVVAILTPMPHMGSDL